jgi:hypothetical protein
MSRTGDWYDNAAMEAFFATLTKECTDRLRFQTRQEARSAIFEYPKFKQFALTKLLNLLQVLVASATQRRSTTMASAGTSATN